MQLCSVHLGSNVSQGWQDTDHHWLQECKGSSCSSNTSSCAAFHTEKKSYQESYISDPLELLLDLEASSRYSLGNEDNKSSTQHLLHCLSFCSKSHGSSHTAGIKLNSQQRECEKSVDEPTGTTWFCGRTSSGSWSSCSSQDTWNYREG